MAFKDVEKFGDWDEGGTYTYYVKAVWQDGTYGYGQMFEGQILNNYLLMDHWRWTGGKLDRYDYAIGQPFLFTKEAMDAIGQMDITYEKYGSREWSFRNLAVEGPVITNVELLDEANHYTNEYSGNDFVWIWEYLYGVWLKVTVTIPHLLPDGRYYLLSLFGDYYSRKFRYCSVYPYLIKMGEAFWVSSGFGSGEPSEPVVSLTYEESSFETEGLSISLAAPTIEPPHEGEDWEEERVKYWDWEGGHLQKIYWHGADIRGDLTLLANYALSKIGGAGESVGDYRIQSIYRGGGGYGYSSLYYGYGGYCGIGPDKIATAMLEMWPQLRREVLCRAWWTSATKYADLGVAVDVERAGWTYAFNLPSDYLGRAEQLWESYHSTTEHRYTVQIDKEIVQGRLFTNVLTNSDGDSAFIKYVFDLQNVSKFDPLLYNAIATKWAAEMANLLRADGGVRRRELLQEYEVLALDVAIGEDTVQNGKWEDGGDYSALEIRDRIEAEE